MVELDWKQVIAKKRQQQQDAIATFSSLLNNDRSWAPYQERIISINNTQDLASAIAKKEFSTETVIKSYISQAIQAHKQSNCLTEILFVEALYRARILDHSLEVNGRPVGPLHGVPVTLKDQYNVKGHDSAITYTSRAFQPVEEDAVLVKILYSLGAIVIAKTNIPQSIMWTETDNPMWGLTTNPFAPEYTPGGSTGGEGAVLSMKGSLLGWGTDLGGSIRSPSGTMGLYGLKPSHTRLPYRGVPVTQEGQEHVPSVIGPLGRSLSSITHVMQEVIKSKPWEKDGRCIPMSWREDIYNETLSRKLVIGILPDDGVVRPHPGVFRVVKEAAEKLRQNGHTIIDWNGDLHDKVIEAQDGFYSADGGKDIRDEIEAGGEPMIPAVKKLTSRGEAIPVWDYWQLNKRKWEIQNEYLEKWNNLTDPETGQVADAVLLPVTPHCSVPHNRTEWVGYTKVWSLLDYTCLVIPGGRVEDIDRNAPWDYAPRNDIDGRNARVWTEFKDEMCEKHFPIGLQIVGRKLEEEKVLAMGKVVESVLRD